MFLSFILIFYSNGDLINIIILFFFLIIVSKSYFQLHALPCSEEGLASRMARHTH